MCYTYIVNATRILVAYCKSNEQILCYLRQYAKVLWRTDQFIVHISSRRPSRTKMLALLKVSIVHFQYNRHIQTLFQIPRIVEKKCYRRFYLYGKTHSNKLTPVRWLILFKFAGYRIDYAWYREQRRRYRRWLLCSFTERKTNFDFRWFPFLLSPSFLSPFFPLSLCALNLFFISLTLSAYFFFFSF